MKLHTITVAVCLSPLVFGQPAFEVASIKPSDPNPSNTMFIGMKADAGTVHYSNITLRDCIRAAYRIRDFQIQGPDWMSTARFEIIAKLPAGASMEQIPEMMQNLLAERFGMVLQHGTKEQSVYALVVGKDGPKLKPAASLPDTQEETALGPDGRPRPLIRMAFLPSGIAVIAPAVSLAALSEMISRFTTRPIVDMTGIAGQYQFDLTFEPETMGGMQAPTMAQDGSKLQSGDPALTLSEAVKRYGLTIDARKAPLDLWSVTKVSRTPTEN